MGWSLRTQDGVGYVQYSNPPENRIPFRALCELDDLLGRISGDQEIKVVALTSGVAGIFSIGSDFGDITAVRRGKPPSAPFESWITTPWRIEDMPQPVVAYVDGLAGNGGCELCLASTFRIGTERAAFRLLEIAQGGIPAAGATQRLPRIVGMPRAAEIIMTARTVEAEEALRIGLLQAIVLDEAGFAEWLRRLTAMSRAGLVAAKRAIVQGSRMPLRDAFEFEQSLFRELLQSSETRSRLG